MLDVAKFQILTRPRTTQKLHFKSINSLETAGAKKIYSQKTVSNTKNSATQWPKLNFEYILLRLSTHFTFSRPYLEGAITQSKVHFSAFPPLRIWKPTQMLCIKYNAWKELRQKRKMLARAKRQFNVPDQSEGESTDQSTLTNVSRISCPRILNTLQVKISDKIMEKFLRIISGA